MSIGSFPEPKECTSAAEFLDHLQLRNSVWLPTKANSSPWAFRGQRRAEWGLEPHAFRTSELDGFKSQDRSKVNEILQNLKIEYRPNEYQPPLNLLCAMIMQLLAEQKAVDEFVNLADEVGHLIPEESGFRLYGDFSLTNLVEALATNYSSTGVPIGERLYEFSGPESIEFALAQHHRIPTRLLDWTFSPLIAAFFAAEETIKKSDSPEMAVWAINYELLDDTDLKVIRPRRAKIGYLHAQEGLFIYDKLANWHFVRTRNWRTFEQLLKESHPETEKPILHKVTLPSTEAKELLRLLAVEHITRAHIMPTFDNVTETLKMKRQISSQ